MTALAVESIDQPTLRVITLVPSATETLLTWGVTPIGVSRFCEHPAIESFGGTKDPAIDRIVSLRPDLVVMCDQENRREDHDALVNAGLDVFAFSITALEHVHPQLNLLWEKLKLADEPAFALDPPSSQRASTAEKIRVFVPIWKRPWMSINAETYASSLLFAAGFQNVCAPMDSRYPELDVDAIAALNPEFVLAPSEPYPFAERHRKLLETIAPVDFVDGKDLFWWGTRTPEALRRLRHMGAA
jgi:ABC-type Fe3+-hydroxamate transport system substrate-binding protein